MARRRHRPGGATAAARDYFGSDLSAGDTNGDGYPDLLVSSNYYDPGVLLAGTGSGITATGARELNVVAAFPQ
ncbi:FG-GAP repeat protein [Streptomyces griseorubiginosus]|uniref:FG-GAP repeat protein n=1 Tax=Streptomyces griseorubiginosus TaxID=67304 RepID=UPI0036EB7708